MHEGDAEHGSRTEGEVLFDLAVAFVLFFMVPQLLYAAFAQDAAAGEVHDRVETGAVLRLVAATLVVVYGVIRLRGKAAWSLRPGAGRSLLLYVLFLVAWIPFAMILFPYLVRAAGYELPPQDTLLYLAGSPRSLAFWGVVAAACIAAPFAEELFFRGFLYDAVRRHAGPWVTVLLSALLFGLIHGRFMIPITVLGILFGYLRMRGGGVGAAIFIHMVHNTWTVAMVMWWPETMQLDYESK